MILFLSVLCALLWLLGGCAWVVAGEAAGNQYAKDPLSRAICYAVWPFMTLFVIFS
jgi:hypothetical protein